MERRHSEHVRHVIRASAYLSLALNLVPRVYGILGQRMVAGNWQPCRPASLLIFFHYKPRSQNQSNQIKCRIFVFKKNKIWLIKLASMLSGGRIEETLTCKMYTGTLTCSSFCIWLLQNQIWWPSPLLNLFLCLFPGHALYRQSTYDCVAEIYVGAWIDCHRIGVLTPRETERHYFTLRDGSRGWYICRGMK